MVHEVKPINKNSNRHNNDTMISTTAVTCFSRINRPELTTPTHRLTHLRKEANAHRSTNADDGVDLTQPHHRQHHEGQQLVRKELEQEEQDTDLSPIFAGGEGALESQQPNGVKQKRSNVQRGEMGIAREQTAAS